MLRSMFTAISSLSLHQQYMDVVADNISNVNTYAFKSSRISFQDQYAQTMSNGSAPTGDLGGVNPTQVGLGVRLGSISPDFTQGLLQSTGRNADLAIQGEGFFIYSEGIKQAYSRDGALDMDANGNLVNSSTGLLIQGWQAALNNGTMTVDPGSALGSIKLPLGTTLARATTSAKLNGNINVATGAPTTYSTSVGVYDSLGQLHSATLTFNRTSGNNWDITASGDGINAASGTSGSAAIGNIAFDANGQFDSTASSIGTLDIATNGADPISSALDMSNITQMATESSVSMASQDGLSAGSFSRFSVDSSTGEVWGVYSNGMQQLIGQLALATFANPGGLSRAEQNLYEIGVNSGDPSIGQAGTDGKGTVQAGYLEGSNVDLGQEFTNMILAQRGFQASSRIITTSDEMLQELVNLKR